MVNIRRGNPQVFYNRALGSVGPSIGSLAPCLQPLHCLIFHGTPIINGWRLNKPDYKENTREELIYKSVFRKHQIQLSPFGRAVSCKL